MLTWTGCIVVEGGWAVDMSDMSVQIFSCICLPQYDRAVPAHMCRIIFVDLKVEDYVLQWFMQ